MMRTTALLTVPLVIFAALMPASLAQQGEISPYSGWAGPDSPLYGLKLFIERIDEELSSGSTHPLKQLAYAEERLSEAKAMAWSNNTQAMERAINGYAIKLGDINATTLCQGIDEDQYSAMARLLERHQNQLSYMANDTTASPETRNCWNNAFQYSLDFGNSLRYARGDGTPGEPAGSGPSRNMSAMPSALIPGAGQCCGLLASYGCRDPNMVCQNCTDNCINNSYSYEYGTNDMSPGPLRNQVEKAGPSAAA